MYEQLLNQYSNRVKKEGFEEKQSLFLENRLKFNSFVIITVIFLISPLQSQISYELFQRSGRLTNQKMQGRRTEIWLILF